MQTLEEATDVIFRNAKETITRLEREGTVGISKACLRQNMSTRGLMCSQSMFEIAFDKAISRIITEQNLMEIY